MGKTTGPSEWAEALRGLVGEKGVFSEAKSLEVFSKDAYYYSPLLRQLLGDKQAELVVAPQGLEELRGVVSYAAQHGIPLTLRGAGTGNYGQCVPLQGGLVVSTHRMNRILEFDPTRGIMRVEAGTRLGQIERRAREQGWELRCYPSTWATAAVGGFVGGGFGGVGSIRHGVLWDGFLKSLRVMEMTPEARVHRIEGPEIFGFIHAYGTSGIMTELEVNLAPALPWEEALLSFPDYASALRFAHALALDAVEPKRLISLHEWPIPSFFKPLVEQGGIRAGWAALLLELADGHTAGVAEKARGYGGVLTYSAPAERYHKGKFCLTDFTWNHTTLWAMKADPGWTYLQSTFAPEPEAALEQMAALREFHRGRVAFHHEYIARSGEIQLVALDLIQDQTQEGIYAAIAQREALGIQVADPHTYYLDADPRWGGQAVLAARAKYDPDRLLNPGKLSSSATEKARAG
ncbi:FAD-binding oxidoreductase [Meiothermus granaticius]|uniref:FAD-binding oxidoreductase n=3 Tax=Meiothermus granaticius TaxID=863370 RepID=UPI0011966C2F|nr:FAD-binding oxidoreductase [Meiothermus granaticius]GEM87200.1 FAD-linked oxidase [Meiothermus granaticius NBRC 107808]